MKKVFTVVINALLFFFIVGVVSGVTIYNGTLISVIIAALIFGLLMLAVIFILKFFKINVNFWSKLLLSVVLAFVFFFMIYNGILGIGSISSSVVDFGLGITVLRLDALGTLIFVSLVSGAASAGLDWLSKA